jgi:HD-GYP domain-containing protein (c-di-GMP phosphodiesterase class II)
VALADAIEAMSSDRPYRKALKLTKIVNEIKQCAGSQYDPVVVEAAVRMLENQAELAENNTELQTELLPILFLPRHLCET